MSSPTISDPSPPVADSFFRGTYGPLTAVVRISAALAEAPSEEDVWDSWERRCLYVGEEELDTSEQRWAQWAREPYPALHAAKAVRIDGRPVIEVAHTYPCAIQIDPRNDIERSRTGERLLQRGDRLWALIGAWPWACDGVRSLALDEGLSPTWSWQGHGVPSPNQLAS